MPVINDTFIGNDSLPMCYESYSVSTSLFKFGAGLFVMLMQIGFGFLEAGTTDARNVTHVLFKNLLDCVVVCITFLAFGYAFAFGDSAEFLGSSKFFLVGQDPCDFVHFFFHLVFAATTATIVSGAATGRPTLIAYLTLTFVMSAFIYPVVVHWTWNKDGWLYQGDGTVGFIDTAGSGVVHVVGGTVSLVATWVLGPRLTRLQRGELATIPAHSIPFAVLGGLLLFVGFIAFNAGSVENFDTVYDVIEVGIAATATIVSASMATLMTTILEHNGTKSLGLLEGINGLLTGCVAVCAGANFLEPWAAVVTGTVAGCVYYFIAQYMRNHMLDDPVNAVAVHLGGGLWGLIAVALFKKDTGIVYLWDRDAFAVLGWNVLGGVAIVTWSVLLSAVTLHILKKAKVLRAPVEAERTGFDGYVHRETAYVGLNNNLMSVYTDALQQGSSKDSFFAENDEEDEPQRPRDQHQNVYLNE